MSDTKRVIKVSSGVYEALKELAARAKTDISATASFLLLSFILQTDAHKTLSPAAQTAIAAEVFDFIAQVAQEEATKLRGGQLRWEEIRRTLEAWKK